MKGLKKEFCMPLNFNEMIENAYRLMDISMNNRSNDDDGRMEGSINTSCTYPELTDRIIYNYISDVPVYRYVPNNPYKINRVKQKYSTTISEALEYICMKVVSSVGYSDYKRMHSDELYKLLGKSYSTILDKAEENGLIKLRRTETRYSSTDVPRFHTEIKVVGRSGSFTRQMITDIDLYSKVTKVRFNAITDGQRDVLFKTYKSLLKSAIDDPAEDVLTEYMQSGDCYPVQDAFGWRVHCPPTWMPSEIRRKLHYIGDPKGQYLEVDLKSSHPYILYQLINKPHLLELAFTDDEILTRLAMIIDSIYFTDEFMYEFGEALERGLFYEFLSDMLEDCCVDWQNFIYNKALDSGDVSLEDDINERQLAKLTFMYLVNGGANTLLREIEQNEFYSCFGRLLLIFNKEFLSSRLDLLGVKDYSPHKNMSMTLQRIESKAMQKAYIEMLPDWGFLIHDSILCRGLDVKYVSESIERSFLELGLAKPITSFK